jgi:enoyl-CoA hydratase/carnithine racemase
MPDRSNAVLIEKGDRIAADPDVGVTGNGKAFSAGGDLLEFRRLLDDSAQRLVETLEFNQHIFEKVERLPMPAVADLLQTQSV